jgi:hypothetical protein
MDYKYILIDTVEKGNTLSELVYSVMQDGSDDTTLRLFATEPYGNQAVMIVPDDIQPIFIKPNFQTVIDNIGILLGDEVFQQGEGFAIVRQMITGSISVPNIIPSGLIRITREEYMSSKPTQTI